MRHIMSMKHCLPKIFAFTIHAQALDTAAQQKALNDIKDEQRRNELANLLSSPYGAYNGYVAIHVQELLTRNIQVGDYRLYTVMPDSNKLHIFPLEVHGGITYTNHLFDIVDATHKQVNRFNLDFDAVIQTIVPSHQDILNSSELNNYLVLGFDTKHPNDTPERWNYEAVVNETLNLIKQIENLLADVKPI